MLLMLGLAGCSSQNGQRLMLMMLGLAGRPGQNGQLLMLMMLGLAGCSSPKRSTADAHDAGPCGVL